MRKNKISKINILRGILIILLLATFVRIFCFSNQNGSLQKLIIKKEDKLLVEY
jgi:hypothetical protein